MRLTSSANLHKVPVLPSSTSPVPMISTRLVGHCGCCPARALKGCRVGFVKLLQIERGAKEKDIRCEQ